VKNLALLLIVFSGLAGCQKLLGFHDTKLEPDAPPPPAIDAPVDAPPPKIDVGDGHDGPLSVTGVTTTDDVRSKMTLDVGANSTLLHVVDSSMFQIGDEVLVFQMRGTAAGTHETHRIASTQPGQLLLATALTNSYAAADAVQVIRVPNYTDVMVQSGGVLTAHAWKSGTTDLDDGTGGVVFFRASGTVTIADGGTLTATAIGFPAGIGGGTGSAGTGGAGGGAGGVLACPLGCNGADVAPSGQNGQVNGGGMPGQGAVSPSGTCASGKGGDGAAAGGLGTQSFATSADGVVIAAVSTGGMNTSANAEHPTLGGGGGAGDGGAGGHGAGGGGGGGGPLSNNALTGQQPSPGQNGTAGGDGGSGGAGGNGGNGGGIVMVAANSLQLIGMVAASGADGTAGTDGTDGGTGGNGGHGGNAAAGCNGGTFYNGGDGAGGNGGDGGGAGGGGGGGAAGVIEIDAFTIAAGGTAQALGGAGMPAGVNGHAGGGGSGFGGAAPPGADGATAAAGTSGSNGFLFLRYVDGCASCDAFGMPTAVVTQL
jgi:hypothetical protein